MAKSDNNQENRQTVDAATITAALQSPDLLSSEQIEELLPHLDSIISWAKQVQEFALDQALKGTKYEGFKVVAGRAVRKFTDTEKVVDALLAEGYDESMLYERSLKSLTQIESLVGKKNFTVLLGTYVDVPQGKPTLVPATDKRPELTPAASAAEDFKE